jgi:DNA repair protein RadC
MRSDPADDPNPVPDPDADRGADPSVPPRDRTVRPTPRRRAADSSQLPSTEPSRAALRPHERLLASGATTLSDVDLLAAFLGTGNRGRSALELARQLLERFAGLHPLLHAQRQALQSIPGIGAARVAQLRAAHELTRRALAEQLRSFPLVNSPAAVRDYLRLTLAALPHEVFAVLFLDAQHRLLASEEMFRGTLTQTSVYPREVVKRALAHNAGAVILAHNHPSGIAEPSRADELLTQSLARALDLVDVRVLDHVIVAGDASVSFAERGLL